MNSVRYFCDLGEAQELKWITSMKNADFAARFPGIKGRRYDGITMMVAHPLDGPDCLLPITRVITYKGQPSRHECSGKCMGGKINGTCECKCGGLNHGRGMFTGLVK